MKYDSDKSHKFCLKIVSFDVDMHILNTIILVILSLFNDIIVKYD